MFEKRNDLLKHLIIIVLNLVAGSVIYFSNDIWIKIGAFSILASIPVIMVRFDLLHPYTWFPPIFALYSLGYPILYAIDGLPGSLMRRFGYSEDLIFLQWIALFTFYLCVSPRKYHVKKTLAKNITDINYYFYLFILIIITAAIINLSNSNFQHKREIYASHNPLYIFSFSAVYILLVIYIFYFLAAYPKYKDISYILVIGTGVITLLLTLYSGERDIFFIYLMITGLSFYSKKIIRNIHLFILVPLGVLLIPLSASFKGILLTGKLGNEFRFSEFIVDFINGEFRSAAQNMQSLLAYREQTEGVFSYLQILKDILRVFISDMSNTLDWFNNMFWYDSKTKYGFTLVGEGFVIDGIVGIIVIFVIFSLTIRLFYKISSRNLYLLTFYICSVPQLMYSIRGDLTNVYSPILKHVVLGLIIVFLLQKVYIEKKLLRIRFN